MIERVIYLSAAGRTTLSVQRVTTDGDKVSQQFGTVEIDSSQKLEAYRQQLQDELTKAVVANEIDAARIVRHGDLVFIIGDESYRKQYVNPADYYTLEDEGQATDGKA